MRAVSKKKAAANRAYAKVRELVHERSDGWCEARLPGCLGRATNCHHVLPRSAGGTDTPDNLLDLCGSGTTGCHGWIEHNRTDAMALGYLKSRYHATGPNHVG